MPCPTTPHRARKNGGQAEPVISARALLRSSGRAFAQPVGLPTLRRFFTFTDDDGGECSAHLHILAAQIAPKLCSNIVRLEKRGRREDRVPNAPAASRAKVKSTRVSHYRFTGNIPAFPAQWFTAALSPVNGLFCHRRLQVTPRRLDSSVAESAIRFCRPLQRHSSTAPPRPSHPAPRFVTIASALLSRRDTRSAQFLIFAKRYFQGQDWKSRSD